MTPRRTSALVVAVALASGAGGAAVYGLADGGGTSTTAPIATATPSPTARPAAAVKTSGGLTVSQIYQRANPGVVDIKVTQSGGNSPTDNFGGPGSPGGGQESQAEGSGFVIDQDGHIATNQHVVDGASSIKVTFSNGHTASAKVVGTDPSTDVAVIKVDAPKSELHPLAFANSNDVQVGDGVVAIGSPFGLEGTVTTGVVSALNRTIDAPNNFTISGAIQTDAAINHGNSGGPLLDTNGNVIGINAQIESDSGGNDGVGFAIPSSMVQNVAQQLISSGKVEHAYLGVQLTDSSGGAGVAQVANGGPADDAGLRNGDVVTAIDGKAVANSDALVTAVDGHKPGDEVTLKVRRGGNTTDIKVKLGTRPSQG